MELQFEEFSKIGRLNKECTITEKIDGVNGQITFDEDGNMLVGSRRREIFPEGTEGKPKGCDQNGLAQWAYKHQALLFDYLGTGRHFGEWAGKGINKRYPRLTGKQFFLFNTFQWETKDNPIPDNLLCAGLTVVPILAIAPFSTELVDKTMADLKNGGSCLSGDNPEGIVIYHHGLSTYMKVTFDFDEGKWSKEK